MANLLIGLEVEVPSSELGVCGLKALCGEQNRQTYAGVLSDLSLRLSLITVVPSNSSLAPGASASVTLQFKVPDFSGFAYDVRKFFLP
jgi:hypothetical protein